MIFLIFIVPFQQVSHLNREVIDIFNKHFNLKVRDGYGQTENTLLVGITKDMELKPGSMGKPTPGNTGRNY